MALASKDGFFITFEGIDGCGKTTQAMLTYRLLKQHGYQVELLREPGSTKVSERIRDILLDRRLKIDSTTELLLYEAARANITTSEITPMLRAGKTVLCDRFYDSTTAYQGYGRRLDIAMVRRLHKVAVGDITPDLTLVFDLGLDEAFSRRQGTPDRLEAQSRAFFKRVRGGFLEIARLERRRVKVVDASPDADTVFAQVRKILARRINLK
ncbi:MAG: dTMP kinase [bacterium]